MATTTITYDNVDQAHFDTALASAKEEFTVTEGADGNSFHASMDGGLVKADATYNSEARKLVVVVQHPKFLVSQALVKTNIDSWFLAKDASATSSVS